jgi:hypothetical protein
MATTCTYLLLHNEDGMRKQASPEYSPLTNQDVLDETDKDIEATSGTTPMSKPS